MVLKPGGATPITNAGIGTAGPATSHSGLLLPSHSAMRSTGAWAHSGTWATRKPDLVFMTPIELVHGSVPTRSRPTWDNDDLSRTASATVINAPTPSNTMNTRTDGTFRSRHGGLWTVPGID